MAGREQDVLDLREEYLKNGCRVVDVDNVIDAWRLNKAGLGKLKTDLGKLRRENMKNPIIAIIPDEKPFFPNVISTYSNSPSIDENFRHVPLEIQTRPILLDESYYLEDQEMIEIQLNTHREKLEHAFELNYNVAVNKTHESTDQDFWIVGRVELRDDDDTDEYFLVTGNDSFRLALNEITQYAIYPGQVILVQGRIQNVDIVVKTIISDPLKDLRIPVNSNSKLQIAVFSGPFTGPDLDFSHFLNTVAQVSKQVNLIIIIGPIVDCENEKINSFFFKAPGSEYENSSYEQLLDSVLVNLSAFKSCKILVVPHQRETCHLFPLPMPELCKTYSKKPDMKLRENAQKNFDHLRIFPDNLLTCPAPGFIEVNKLNVHIVPFDIVLEIIQSLNIKSNSNVNKTQIALSQLINQHTYLPVIPNGLPVEYTKYRFFCPDNFPNILIINSKMSIKPDLIPGMTCVKMIGYYEGKNIGNYSIITSAPGQNELQVSVKNFRA